MLSDSATKSTVLANILGRVHKLDLQHEKLVRDQEAIEYITLPATPDDMRRDYPKQFSSAYPNASGLPMRAPKELEQADMFLDTTFRCRSGVGGVPEGCRSGNGDNREPLTEAIDALARLLGQSCCCWTLLMGGASEQPTGRPMRSRSLASVLSEPSAAAITRVVIDILESDPAAGASGKSAVEDDTTSGLALVGLPAEAASTPPEPASGFAAELAISPASGHARGPAPSGPAAAHGGLAPSQNGPEKVEARLAKVLGKLDVKKDDRAQAAKAAKLKKAELAKAAKEAKRLAEEQREAEVIATPVDLDYDDDDCCVNGCRGTQFLTMCYNCRHPVCANHRRVGADGPRRRWWECPCCHGW